MITAEDYEYLTQLLKNQAGMSLGPDKAYLIRSRLEPLARKMGLDGLPGLFAKLRLKDMALEKSVVEAMLTNESLFFRDPAVFEKLRDEVLPSIMEKTKFVRIWSAACSTGQEPYSIAMMLAGSAWESKGFMFEIVATDLSRGALSRAMQGIYTDLEAQRGLTPELLTRYFDKIEDGWKVKPDIARRVSFHNANLTRLNGAFGQFDLIFCRNMLIYCDLPVKKGIVDQLHAALKPQGYLVLGGSENLLNVSDAFDWPKSVGASIYRKK